MAEYGTFTMSGAPITPASFTMYDPPPGEEENNPVDYTKKIKTRAKQQTRSIKLQSTRSLSPSRNYYYKDP